MTRNLLAFVIGAAVAAILIWLAALAAATFVYAAEVPNNSLTPGAWRKITVKELCSTKWGKDRRAVTASMKTEVYRRYHEVNHKGICAGKQGCEVDHRGPRELGGQDVIENLWIEPYQGSCNAHNKDRLENFAHRQVCAGNLTLKAARAIFDGDWRKAYQKQFGSC